VPPSFPFSWLPLAILIWVGEDPVGILTAPPYPLADIGVARRNLSEVPAPRPRLKIPRSCAIWAAIGCASAQPRRPMPDIKANPARWLQGPAEMGEIAGQVGVGIGGQNLSSRRMYARDLQAKGASLRVIARELGISPAAAMRDLRDD